MPGTHDVALGVEVLARLVVGQPVALPRFDKATDAPRPVAEWPVVERADVVVFEGWCVGAVAQPDAALLTPVNDLERDDDPDGTWRQFVNAQLAGPYRALFAPLDRLILLRPPDFATVVGWRQAAERAAAGPMTAGRGRRFRRTVRAAHAATSMPKCRPAPTSSLRLSRRPRRGGIAFRSLRR